MMKINIYSYVYWPEYFLINELAEELSKSGDQVVVSTGLPNYQTGNYAKGYSWLGPYSEELRGVQIRRYWVFPRGRGFARLAVNYLSNLILGALNIFRMPRADWHFVFATSPIFTAIPAILAAKLRGGKVCIWLQDLWPDSLQAVGVGQEKALLNRCVGKVVQWVYQNTDLMLIQSPNFKGNLERYDYKGRTEVIYNWAPSIDYSQAADRDWLPSKTGRLVLSFAGNIGRAQALNLVMDVVKEFDSELELWLVGDGSELSGLKLKAEAEAISNVKFLGRRPVSDMSSLFSESDALLVSLTSDTTFFNTIPSKVPAYMAAGKPVLGFLSGAGARVIEEAGGGLCADAGDRNALKNALTQLVKSSKEDREYWGGNALSYFYENFQKDRLIKRIKNLLEGDL